MKWLFESEVVIAEVSTPSLGVGYELAKAEAWQKKVLCLYRKQDGRRLSPMVSGSKAFEIGCYETVEDAKKHIDGFMKSLN